MTFASSDYVPVALGFFGLGTGYLIWGPQELFVFPKRDAQVDRAEGVWGLFLPGLCQVVTGVILFIGLTWFQVFKNDPPLYMAAVAFTAYGIHWFALGWNRYQGNGVKTNVGMGIAFTVLSATGAFVFFTAGAWAVGVLFVGLTLIYLAEIGVGGGLGAAWERTLGLFHTATGLWLMYLTVAEILNLTNGSNLPSG